MMHPHQMVATQQMESVVQNKLHAAHFQMKFQDSNTHNHFY
jgi:hypothetical protein